MEAEAIFLTFKLSLISTTVLVIVGFPLAFWLSQTNSRMKYFINAIVSLPLVLPPTVIGFYLLVGLGNQSWVGQFLNKIGIGPLAFSFSGLVVGSIIYSLPFVVNPIRNSISAIDPRLIEAAEVMGILRSRKISKLILPLAWPGLISGAILGFIHTIGEFGIVLMFGGNIPGETRVLSLAIYEFVESLEYEKAHVHSLFILILSFVTLVSINYFVNKRKFEAI